MNIIGRKKEAKEFHRLFVSSQPELVVIHGRRGVGVSTFTKEILKDKIDFSFSLTNEKSSLKDNLALWQQAINKISLDKDNLFGLPKNWKEAFEQLKHVLTNRKTKSQRRVIVFHGFEKMNTNGSQMVASFCNFWNSWAVKRKSTFIVLTDTTSSWQLRMMHKKEKAFSHLLTSELQIKPFTLHETNLFFKQRGVQLTKKEIAKYYMIFGGIPFYLKQIHKTGRLIHNIKRIFAAETGKLKNEYNDLITTFISNTIVCEDILRVLASDNNGLTRDVILAQTGYKSGGSVTSAFNEMIKVGWIESYVPWNTNHYHANYKIIDPFLLFYFRILSTGKLANISVSEFSYDHVDWQEWADAAFTNMCIAHEKQLKKAINSERESLKRVSWHRQENESLRDYQQDLIYRGANRKTFVFDFIFTENPVLLDEEYYNFFYKKFEVYRFFTQKKQNAIPVLATFTGVDVKSSVDPSQQIITINHLFKSN